MSSSLIILAVIIIYVFAYFTYGKFLSTKIFNLDSKAKCPSETLKDNIDYVPANKQVLFGHHFTSIAGTGPIVGPAIGVIWGWLPALIWIILGSIFMGAVHDLGSMIVSIRNNGRSIGDICAKYISNRVRFLFLFVMFFGLLIVVAIFGVVIASMFDMFPQSVIPVWLQIPIAIWAGHMIYKRNYSYKIVGLIAVFLMYLTIILGAYYPIKMPEILNISPVGVWVIIFLIYAYIASILPVQTLLQPRDYINYYQLVIAMALLIVGILVSNPQMVAPVVNLNPIGAPPILPILFVIISCGAISGFHSLVSSGTSSKQCDNESSCLYIGYGSMLLEGIVGVSVLIACAAGIGLGLNHQGEFLTGTAAFESHYATWQAASGLTSKLSAFVLGSVNMISSLNIPNNILIAIIAVFIVSFSSTTLDTATRLQRYTITEISEALGFKLFTNRYIATFIAIITALLLAFYNGTGEGALAIWPLFGSTNQLLAVLALLVISVYLAYKKKPIYYTFIPMLFMVIITFWAIILNIQEFFIKSNWLLFIIGIVIFILELWVIIESIIVLRKAYLSKN